MRILAIDTALGACSACVLDTADMAKPLAIEQIAMDRVAVATPIRGEELTKLLGGIMDILREAGKQHAEQAARDMEIEKMFSDDLFEDF